MGAGWTIDTLAPQALDTRLRERWCAFRSRNPALASPYFDLRYTLAAGEVAPGAEVAVVSRAGEVAGFLPFQRRGALIQPIAAPLTDYHGLIASPDATIDLTEITAALGARRFRFGGLVGAPPAQSLRLEAMGADLSNGFDAWTRTRPPGFLKDKRRRARRLEEDHGALSFSLSSDDDEALDFVMRVKRRQMWRTGQHDVLAGPWALAFLHHLAESAGSDFGLRIAALRAGGSLVSAEIGLRSGAVHHLWLPAYDPAFSKYSPGALLTVETLRLAADDGVRLVDFGPGREAYKSDYATATGEVYEGDVTVGGWVEATRSATRLALAPTPAVLSAVTAATDRLDRRWDRITACEPSVEGRVGAASVTLGQMAAKRPKTSIGVGLGLSLGVAALLAE